ncbi:glycine/D-amino acid oxidase-like deaminating enzyme [Rhizobium sp. BK275]|nr:glycine/D-amino acid oxidase-like deaminating enzyme [Rhizobium sp. BK275]
MKKTKITANWAGYIDSISDGVSGIGEAESLPGFILVAGFSGHGFDICPGAGHLIADIVTGAGPIVDPKPYRPRRFRASAWGKVAEF